MSHALFLICVIFFCSTAGLISETGKSADSSGFAAFHRANYADALDAVLTDTGFTDSSFRFFKLGCAHAGLGNDSKAMFYLRNAAQLKTAWSPFACEKIGDIELKNNRPENSLKAYRAALDDAGNQRYQYYLYGTMYRLITQYADEIGSIPWLEEIPGPPPSGIEINPCDLIERLIEEEAWTEVDSLVMELLDSSEYNQTQCAIAARLIKEPVPDSVLTTKAMFKLSKIASQCKNYQAASDWLLEALSRPDFNSAISEKSYLYHRADLNYKLRNYNKALRWLRKYEKKYGPSPEIVSMIARCYRSMGKTAQAAEWYARFIKDYPRHSFTPDIIWYLAWEKEELGDGAGARELYKKLFSDYSRGQKSDDALFRYGLSFVRDSADSQALDAFTQYALKYRDSEQIPAAQYWRCKCLRKLGRDSTAKAELAVLTRSFPADYYAAKAREMLLSLGDSLNAQFHIDTNTDINSAAGWLDSISGPAAQRLTPGDSQSLTVGLSLAAIGMHEHADFFLEPVAVHYQKNLSLLLLLADAYLRADDFTGSFLIARRFAWRVPQEARQAMPLALYSLMYPQAFSAHVVRHADKFGVDPNLVYAIIKQESQFNPGIASPVGAIGLMQIMPYTGKEIADDLNEPFSVDSLSSPAFNIHFGCYYISKLLKQFNGDIVCAVASYNGGPHNVKKWIERNKGEEPDLFIEDIVFSETRTYVKRVLGNYWIYRKLGQNN